MTTLKEIEPKAKEAVVKRAALVTRVSTDRQARNQEGSLVNQIQRLRQHIEYKTNACGENWVEAGVYELKGISGKNSMRSKEFERLFADIAAGRVNTVLCTALDRICRSVKDFLWFFEFLHDHNAEFVCLKQNYDTTSSQGQTLCDDDDGAGGIRTGANFRADQGCGGSQVGAWIMERRQVIRV